MRPDVNRFLRRHGEGRKNCTPHKTQRNTCFLEWKTGGKAPVSSRLTCGEPQTPASAESIEQ